MNTRILAIFILVIAFVSFPINKTVDVEINISKHQEPVVRTKATMEEKKANKALAKKIAWVGYGWKDKEWICLDKIFVKEAKYDHLAKNKSGSSAFGIGQRLKETSKDPMVQVLHTYKYIQHRYKNPCSAWRFHTRHNYY